MSQQFILSDLDEWQLERLRALAGVDISGFKSNTPVFDIFKALGKTDHSAKIYVRKAIDIPAKKAASS